MSRLLSPFFSFPLLTNLTVLPELSGGGVKCSVRQCYGVCHEDDNRENEVEFNYAAEGSLVLKPFGRGSCIKYQISLYQVGISMVSVSVYYIRVFLI